MSARTRRRFWWSAAIGVAILACFILAAWYLTSARFQSHVRARVIAGLEEATGGRVELGAISWKLYKLSFDLHDLTIHGRERPDEAPYIHVDRLQARANILSLLGREIGLRDLEMDRPQVHLIVYPDGTTNQPPPAPRNRTDPLDRLFAISMRHLELRNGELRLNDQPLPFNIVADDVAAAMNYRPADARYDGHLRVGRIAFRYPDFLPVNSEVAAEFRLWRTAADLTSVLWKSGNSVVQVHGRLPDFRNPRLELTYDANLDLAQLSRVTHFSEVRGGSVQLRGEGSYSASDFSSLGTVVVRDLAYRNSSVRITNANGGAQFSVTRNRLLVPHLFAHVFGGTIFGDAEIRNWRAGVQTGAPGTQQGTAHLRAQNLPIRALVGAMNSFQDLRELHLAGAMTGKTDVQWTRSLHDARANLAVQITPANASPGELPVSGRIEAEYFGRNDALRVAALDVASRATRLVASGTMGNGAENLQVSVSTNNLGELQPALKLVLGPGTLPVELGGQASFSGRVYGRVSSPAIAGHLEATDFDTMLPAAAAQQRIGQRIVHWNSIAVDVLYSPTVAAARNAILRSGRAQFNFDFSAALQRGAIRDDSALSGHLLVRNAALSDLQALAGYRYPIAGTVDASVAVTGTRGDPRASARISGTKLVAYGEPVSSASADVEFAKGEAQFSNINVVHNGARVTGTGAWNPATTGFRVDLTGSNFNLARVRDLQRQRLSVGGMMSFSLRASGTRDAPAINGNLHIAGLTLNGERAGDFSATAVTAGDELRLLGRSTAQNPDLHLDGTVRLRGDYPANLMLTFAHLDFDALLRAYLEGRVTGHSSAAGKVDVRGPLRRPENLDVTGAIDQLSAEIATVKIWNDGPLTFHMADQVFRLERLQLLGEETSVKATGTIQLTGAQRLDIRSDGRVNLKLLQSYRPEFTSYGTFNFGLNVGGVLDRPQIQGQAQIANAGISYVDLPNGLSDVNGVLVFNRDRLAVQSFTARTGGGTVSVGGFVTYGRTFGFNLTANAHDVRLRYPAGVSSMADANLTVTGSLENATLAGDLTITKFGVNPQFDFAQYLARAKQAPELSPPNSPLNNVHLDLHVASTPELQVQTSLAKLSGDLDLRLRGTAAKPIVLGRVNIIEGDVVFNGAKYRMERGDVTFTNPVRIEPVLDIEATARVKEYDVTLGFHGPMDRLTTTYRSDPPLPTADIIALLALGHTREETAVQQQTQQPSFTQAASYAILGEALNAAVSSRAQRIFGVSRIKIDPQATNETGVNTSSPRLSIEQQVNNNITLTYITNLSQGGQQTIQFQYDVNRNVSIIAIRDDVTGVVSFDVKIRQRRK